MPIRLNGRMGPLEEVHQVAAGPVQATIAGPDLRSVRIHGVDIAERVYVAVRDDVWNTIPGTYSDFNLKIEDESFSFSFKGSHRYRELHFTWTGRINGFADGTIKYSMTGRAENEFDFNKIGFNVHHPLAGSVGRPYRAGGPDGPVEGTLPVTIAPQSVENGQLTAIFPPYDELEITISDRIAVRFDFEGDLFEMQDHRNWTDANFKSYGTPMRVPYPMHAVSGQEFRQVVTIRPILNGADSVPDVPMPRVEALLGGSAIRVPVGLSVPEQARALSSVQAHLLSQLGFDHLRCDVHCLRSDWESDLRTALETVVQLGSDLELALFVADSVADSTFARLTSVLQEKDVNVARVFVYLESETFSDSALCTPPGLARRIAGWFHQHLRADLQVCGGTDKFFAEVNRDRAASQDYDGLVYSINPQVHADDDWSLLRNARGQADTVETARTFFNGPVFLSPVTIASRKGPYAGGPPVDGDLPPNVDVRQASLWAAVWTLCSLRGLLASNAAAITYFETVGWRGVVAPSGGAPDPRFPAGPGAVYPVYHVLADALEWKGAQLADHTNSDPRRVEALILRRAGAMRVLVSNLTYSPLQVEVAGLPPVPRSLRILDEHSLVLAMADPIRFRATGTPMPISDKTILKLEPVATALLTLDPPD